MVNIHEIRPFSTLIGQTDLGVDAGERGSTCKASATDGQKESVISAAHSGFCVIVRTVLWINRTRVLNGALNDLVFNIYLKPIL